MFLPRGRDVAMKIKERSLISLLSESGKQITERIDCLSSANSDANYFYTSKEIVIQARETIFFSRRCDQRIRTRIARVHTHAMEAGIVLKYFNEMAPNVIDIEFGKHVSVYCLYRDRNVSKFGFSSFHFSAIKDLVILVIKCFCACLGVLFVEVLSAKLKKVKRRYRVHVFTIRT